MTLPSWLSIRILGAGVEGRESNQFEQPRGVCYDAISHEIMVTDCNNHRIQIFQYETLAFVRQIGKGVQGSSPGYFNYAVGMCIDNKQTLGRVYVADTSNHRISVFYRQTGEFIRTIGSQQGNLPGQFSSPYGVCIDNDSGHIYVADYDNHRIQVIDIDGTFVKVIGSGRGSNPGQLNQPIVVCIDELKSYLYVADYSNNRIQVFHKDTGEYLTMICSTSSGQSDDSLNGPRGLCLAGDYLFVTDRENHRIKIYDKTTHNFIRNIGGESGTGSGQFNRPMELCANIEDGSIIVVDGYNHRVQIMEIPELQPYKMASRMQSKLRTLTDERISRAGAASKTALTISLHEISLKKFISNGVVEGLLLRPRNLGHLYHIFVTDSSLIDHISSSDLGLKTVSEATYSPKEPDHNDDIIQLQAKSLLSLLREISKANGASKHYLPVLAALDQIRKRGWKPSNIDSTTIMILIEILISCLRSNEAINEDDWQGYEAIVNILLAISNDRKAAFEMFHTFHNVFRSQNSKMSFTADMDRSWITISRVMSELMKVIINDDNKNASEWFHGKDSSSLLNDILNFMFGNDLVSRLITVANSKTISKNSSKSSPSSPRMQMSEKIWNVQSSQRFSCLLEALFDLSEYIVNFHAKESYAQSAAALQDSYYDAKIQLIRKSYNYIDMRLSQDSLANSHLRTKSLFRGNRHIWQEYEPFQVGDLIDCMDKEKSWFESYITELLPNGGVQVHFMGWGSKWDDAVSASEIEFRIAPLNSKTKNWRAELFEGGLIEIKCNEDTVNQKWMWGKILALNVEEEWVDVAYTFGSDATINKRAHLYGENICPIGMHTKEKSKSAAASVIKPAKKVQEAIKLRQDSSSINDEYYLDKDDDYLEKNNTVNSASTDILESVYIDNGILSIHGLGGVTILVFQSIMKTLVDYLDNVSSQASTLDESALSDINYLFDALFSSPYKQLMTRFIIRPFIVRSALQAQLSSSLSSSKLFSDFNQVVNHMKPSVIVQIIDNIEKFSLSRASILKEYIGNRMNESIFNKIVKKLHSSIDRCSFNDLMQILIYGKSIENSNNTIVNCSDCIMYHLIYDYAGDSYSDTDVAAMRKILCHCLRLANIEQLSRLEEIWMNVTCQQFLAVFHTNKVMQAIETSAVLKVDSIIFLLKKCRNISRDDFDCMGEFYFSGERGIHKAFNELPLFLCEIVCEVIAKEIAKLLEQSSCNTLNGDDAVERSNRLYSYEDLVKVLSGDNSLIHFNEVYLELLTFRLIYRRYVSLELELSAINILFSNSPTYQEKLSHMVLDYMSKPNTTYDMFLREVADSFDLEVDSQDKEMHAIDILLNGDFQVTTLSAATWSTRHINSLLFADLRLPSSLKYIQAEYSSHFKSLSGPAKQTLHWCLGYGMVQLACIGHSRYSNLIIEGSEAEVTLLIAFSKLASSIHCQVEYQLVQKAVGVSIDLFDAILTSLTSSECPLLEIHTVQTINQSGNDEKIISFSKEFVNGEFLSYASNDSFDSFVVKIPSNTMKLRRKSESYSDWMSQVIDASIVRSLKRIAGMKSYLDHSPTTSPFMSLDQLKRSILSDIKIQKSLLSSSQLSQLIQDRCSYLVESGVIDCLALKRQDEIFGSNTVPNQNNYLYCYILPKDSSFNTSNTTKAAIPITKERPTGNDLFVQQANALFKRLVTTLKLAENTDNIKQHRTMSFNVAANESKDHEHSPQQSERCSHFASSEAIEGSLLITTQIGNQIDHETLRISEERFVTSFSQWILNNANMWFNPIIPMMEVINGDCNNSYQSLNKIMFEHLQQSAKRTVMDAIKQVLSLSYEGSLLKDYDDIYDRKQRQSYSDFMSKLEIPTKVYDDSHDYILDFMNGLPVEIQLKIAKIFKTITNSLTIESDIIASYWNAAIPIVSKDRFESSLALMSIPKTKFMDFYNSLVLFCRLAPLSDPAIYSEDFTNIEPEKPSDDESKDSSPPKHTVISTSTLIESSESFSMSLKYFFVYLLRYACKSSADIKNMSNAEFVSVSNHSPINASTNKFSGFGKTSGTVYTSPNSSIQLTGNRSDKRKKRSKPSTSISSNRSTPSTRAYSPTLAFDISSINASEKRDLGDATSHARKGFIDRISSQLDTSSVSNVTSAALAIPIDSQPVKDNVCVNLDIDRIDSRSTKPHFHLPNRFNDTDLNQSFQIDDNSFSYNLDSYLSDLLGVTPSSSRYRPESDTFMRVCNIYLALTDLKDAVSNDGCLKWLSEWVPFPSLQSLFKALFRFLDCNGDGYLDLHDVSEKIRVSVDSDTLEHECESPRKSIITATDKGQSRKVNAMDLSHNSSKLSSSTSDFLALWYELTDDAMNLDVCMRHLFQLTNDILKVFDGHGILTDPAIIVTLLPLYRWDSNRVLDELVGNERDLNDSSGAHLFVSSFSFMDIVPKDSRNVCLGCKRESCHLHDTLTSFGCDHCYCKPCLSIYLTNELINREDINFISCPYNSSADRINQSSHSLSCNHKVCGQVIENILGIDERVRFTSLVFRYSVKKYREFISGSISGCCNIPLSSSRRNISNTSFAVVNTSPFHLCPHCGNYEHYPITCTVLRQFYRSEVIDLKSFPRTMKSLNHSSYYQKYTSCIHYLRQCEQAYNYYQKLLMIGLSPYDNQSNHERIVHLYDKKQSDYVVITKQLFSWRVIGRCFSLLAHTEPVKKIFNLQSESIIIQMDVLEESCRYCFNVMNESWIRSSTDNHRIMSSVKGLSIIYDRIVEEFNQLTYRLINDFRYRLSENIFCRKLDSDSHRKNMLDDSFLGHYDHWNISTPLSTIDWNSFDMDMDYLSAIRIFLARQDSKCSMLSRSDIDSQKDVITIRPIFWDVAMHPFGYFAGINNRIKDDMSNTLLSWNDHLSDSFAIPLISNANHPLEQFTRKSTSNYHNDTIYLTQQRLFLISKAMSIVSNIPFQSLSAECVRMIVLMLKHVISFYAWYGHMTNQYLSSPSDMILEENSMKILLEDKCLDFMLDMGLCKALLSMYQCWSRIEPEIAIYTILCLIGGATCVQGFSILLASIDGFLKTILFLDDTHQRNKTSLRINPIEDDIDTRRRHQLKDYQTRLLLCIASDLHKAGAEKTVMIVRQDLIWTNNISVRWNIVLDIISLVLSSLTSSSSSHRNIRGIVHIGYNKSFTISDCLVYLNEILPQLSQTNATLDDSSNIYRREFLCQIFMICKEISKHVRSDGKEFAFDAYTTLMNVNHCLRRVWDDNNVDIDEILNSLMNEVMEWTPLETLSHWSETIILILESIMKMNPMDMDYIVLFLSRLLNAIYERYFMTMEETSTIITKQQEYVDHTNLTAPLIIPKIISCMDDLEIADKLSSNMFKSMNRSILWMNHFYSTKGDSDYVNLLRTSDDRIFSMFYQSLIRLLNNQESLLSFEMILAIMEVIEESVNERRFSHCDRDEVILQLSNLF